MGRLDANIYRVRHACTGSTKLLGFVCTAAFWALSGGVLSATIEGQVVAITDGDTIKILTPAKQQIKVRLADIDTPSAANPTAERRARCSVRRSTGARSTSRKSPSTAISAWSAGCSLDGRNINAEMVEDGAAWVYRKYSDDPQLFQLERQAREQGGTVGAPAGPADATVGMAEKQRSNDGDPKEHRPLPLLLALPVFYSADPSPACSMAGY